MRVSKKHHCSLPCSGQVHREGTGFNSLSMPIRLKTRCYEQHVSLVSSSPIKELLRVHVWLYPVLPGVHLCTSGCSKKENGLHYLIIKYVYLRIKRSYLIQGYLAIKKWRENPQLFGAGGPQVPIRSQNYVLVMVKAGSDAAYRKVLARKISLCERREQR